MLLGEYEHAIDDKGRFTVPAKFRNRLASGMVVTKGITNPKAREFRRQVLGGASHSVPDKQGRIILLPRLREYANIDKHAVIIGLDDHCEIWNPETWRELQEQSDSNPDERAEQFAELGI
jgi:MraZ protein